MPKVNGTKYGSTITPVILAHVRFDCLFQGLERRSETTFE